MSDEGFKAFDGLFGIVDEFLVCSFACGGGEGGSDTSGAWHAVADGEGVLFFDGTDEPDGECFVDVEEDGEFNGTGWGVRDVGQNGSEGVSERVSDVSDAGFGGSGLVGGGVGELVMQVATFHSVSYRVDVW